MQCTEKQGFGFEMHSCVGGLHDVPFALSGCVWGSIHQLRTQSFFSFSLGARLLFLFPFAGVKCDSKKNEQQKRHQTLVPLCHAKEANAFMQPTHDYL